jgi:hypothetical protein
MAKTFEERYPSLSVEEMMEIIINRGRVFDRGRDFLIEIQEHVKEELTEDVAVPTGIQQRASVLALGAVYGIMGYRMAQVNPEKTEMGVDGLRHTLIAMFTWGYVAGRDRALESEEGGEKE